jgi:hypothetical protein
MESANKTESRGVWYTAEQIKEMGEKAKVIVDIKDRKCKDMIYNSCFIGREYCKWFIVNGVSFKDRVAKRGTSNLMNLLLSFLPFYNMDRDSLLILVCKECW